MLLKLIRWRLGKAVATALTSLAVSALWTTWPAAAGGGGSSEAQAGQVSGRIVYVDDGDTAVMLLHDNSKLKIRLASIDAPEVSHTSHEVDRIGQPYSNNSKEFLRSLIHGRVVRADCPEKDRYGRSVCTLTVGGTNVNAEMVRNGWAWANTANHGAYLRDRSFVELQREARIAQRGLWQGRNPVEPWSWRHVCWESARTACPNDEPSPGLGDQRDKRVAHGSGR